MTSRTANCAKPESSVRLAQARAFLSVGELVVDANDDIATPQVAAALAVLSGIASSDAVCCARLGRRSRSQDHRDAVDLLSSVQGAESMAKDLRRLLDIKDASHYAATIVGGGQAKDAVGWARRMINAAESVLGH